VSLVKISAFENHTLLMAKMNFAHIVYVSCPGEKNSIDLMFIKLLNVLSFKAIGAVKATPYLRV
jgi:hypothetical protein